jgi:enoyl-CoA hydratase/carnithine racemase
MTITDSTAGSGHATTRLRCLLNDGVADVQLARPDKMNAVDAQMLSELSETALSLRKTPGLRAVVLSGEGRAFCAGLDMAALAAMSAGQTSGWSTARQPGEGAGLGLSGAQQVIWDWATMPVPVIAAVHGAAVGAGLQIALAADLRIVAPDAKLGMFEVRWGVVPDMLGTYLLPRLVGSEGALEMTCTGSVVSGEAAVGIGLASRVAADPRLEALTLAGEIACRSPHAVRAAKALLTRGDEKSLRIAARAERVAMAELMGSANQVEAVRAAAEKREPEFVDAEAARRSGAPTE